MKIGLISPNAHYGIPPAELARDLEERGYESLWYGEHTHIPVSRESPHPGGAELPEVYRHVRSPFVSLGAAAAVTSKLKFGTAVCLVLQHQVLDLAKMIATLDTLSNSRFLFGAGCGWNKEELANASTVPWSKRFSGMRETIQAMRRLWADEIASYDGDFVKFSPSWAYPKTTSPSGPPLLLGAQASVGLRHVAEYADEWLPRDGRFEDLEAGFKAFYEALDAVGRDPATIPISMISFYPPTAQTVEAHMKRGVHRVIFFGPEKAEDH